MDESHALVAFAALSQETRLRVVRLLVRAGPEGMAAGAIGDTQTQRACEQILEQEIAMSKWLLEHLPETTREFLARSEMPGETAKK